MRQGHCRQSDLTKIHNFTKDYNHTKVNSINTAFNMTVIHPVAISFTDRPRPSAGPNRECYPATARRVCSGVWETPLRRFRIPRHLFPRRAPRYTTCRSGGNSWPHVAKNTRSLRPSSARSSGGQEAARPRRSTMTMTRTRPNRSFNRRMTS